MSSSNGPCRGLLSIVVGACAALGPVVAQAQDGLEPPRATRERGLVFAAPETWRATEPLESEREAWIVPPAAAGARRLRVALLRNKRGKSVDERVARWAAAFEDADRRPLAASAVKRETIPVPDAEGVTATLVSLAGAFVGALEPGAEERLRREGWSALHAVLEGPDGTWVASVVGPSAAVDACRDGFVALIKAVRIGMIEVPVEVAPPPEPATEAEPDEPEGDEGE